MGIPEIGRVGGGATTKSVAGGGWGVVAKPCDYCNSAAALLFCRVDSAFMCMACDAKVHSANKLAVKHERVWMCEVCEQAPASVTCKADAAALCVTCDRDIHSANPLARRHERIPVVPFYDTAESVVKSTAASILLPVGESDTVNNTPAFPHQSYNSDPWTTSIHSKIEEDDSPDVKSMGLLFSDTDNFLDFDFPLSDTNRFQQHYTTGSDSVVPVQTTIKPSISAQFAQENRFEIDFTKPNIGSYNHSTYSVSSSSMDVGVVPDGSSMSDISYPFVQNMTGGSVDMIPGCAGANSSSQLGAPGITMDREARVMRYREKRKNRKFEKTIRYASRKAYAETRPRIKGRFAKRTEVHESEMESLFSSSSSAGGFFADSIGYGVVPSF